jgi:hypothetical protein
LAHLCVCFDHDVHREAAWLRKALDEHFIEHAGIETTRLGEVVCLSQFRGAVLAAHLDRLAAHLDLDWIVAELAIAGSAGRLCHDAHLHEHPKMS